MRMTVLKCVFTVQLSENRQQSQQNKAKVEINLFSKMERFASLNEEQMQIILNEKASINTQKAGYVMFNIFVKYCKEKNIAFDPKTITKGELNQSLRSFYVEVRKEDGTLYKKTSLTALRFGLQREIKKDSSRSKHNR